MRRRLVAAAALSVCVLVAAGCGGGGSSTFTGQSLSLDELSRSASSSADATSGRFAFAVRAELPGGQGPLSFSGEGAFDKGSGRASWSVDMSSFAKLLGRLFSAFAGPKQKDTPSFDDPAGWRIEVVQDDKVGYVRFPAISKQLPSGKSWIRSDGKSVKVGGFEVGELENSARTDPREMLDVLRAAAGEVETVGTERLRGTETTHYRATVAPSEYAKLVASASTAKAAPLTEQLAAQSELGPIPVDVWLDDHGLVRKLALAFSTAKPGGSETGRTTMSFELWDYGENVAIDLPLPDEVVDASALQH